MTLDESIKHAEEVAEQNEWFEKNYLENKGCKECAEEHRQLAEWLKDYKRLLEQEPKTGHWITQWNVAHQKEYYYCSECREEFSYDGETGIKMNDYDFCPNCGAKMVEPQEERDKE